MSNSKVIYTSIVGGYDPLRQPDVVDGSFDYICFTDDLPEGRVGVWQIRRIPGGTADPARRSRRVKILPHEVLGEYEWSVWIDANIKITQEEFYAHVSDAIQSGCPAAQLPHPYRDCIYEEALHCYKVGRADLCGTSRQLKHLRAEGFPRHYGLFENNVILRKHCDEKVMQADRMWWDEYNRYTRRDQFSLMYVYWKLSLMPSALLGEGINARNATCLEYYLHGCDTPASAKSENCRQEGKRHLARFLASGIRYRCRLVVLFFLKHRYAQ